MSANEIKQSFPEHKLIKATNGGQLTYGYLR